MPFNLPAAQYLMNSNSSNNRGVEGSPSTGQKTAGNLPITSNAAQIQNNTASSLTGPPDRIYFGINSQISTTGVDVSNDTKVLLTSVQYNAPNRIQSSTMANEGASVTVVSGTTEANYRRFLVGGNDTPFCSSQAGPVTMCIDPTADSFDSTGGTFDETNFSGWGFGCVRYNLQGSSSLLCFWQRVFLFDTTKSAANMPNFTGPSDWSQAFTAVQGTDYTDKIGAWLTRAGDTFFVPCPFQFGDGSTATIFNDNGANVVSPGDNLAGQENFRLSTQAMRVYLNQRNNAADSVTLSGNYAWGTAAPWDFNENNAASCTLSGTFAGMGDFTLGGSVTAPGVFSLASGSNVISSGADIDFITVNGDLDIQGNTVTTFIGVTCTGAMDFDTAGTYTLDGCTIDEVTNSSGGNVTLNLINGATVTTNTGPNITIVQSFDYTITNLDQNAVVTIVDLDDNNSLLFEETAGVDNTVTYPFDGATTGTNIGVFIRNTTIRNQEFDDVLPAASTSFPVSQVADTVYI